MDQVIEKEWEVELMSREKNILKFKTSAETMYQAEYNAIEYVNNNSYMQYGYRIKNVTLLKN